MLLFNYSYDPPFLNKDHEIRAHILSQFRYSPIRTRRFDAFNHPKVQSKSGDGEMRLALRFDF